MARRRHFLKSSNCQKLCDYIQGYFAVSTIHGFSHIVNKGTHLIEKIFWSILVAVAFYGGCVLSNVTLNRYYTNPIVISIERDRFSWTTAFPAVTICPAQRIDEVALDQHLDTIISNNKTFLREFIISLAYANYTNLEDVLDNDEIQPKDYISVLQKIRYIYKLDLIFSGQTLNAKKWIFETITEMGFCYSFNSPLAVYSSYKYWKSNKWKIIPHLKNLESHPLDGEAFAIIINITSDYVVSRCNRRLVFLEIWAFKVVACDLLLYVALKNTAYFHGPYEVVDIRSKPIYQPLASFLEIYPTALSIISSDDTKQLSVSQRKCRYYYESNLLHFPVYTSVICRMECRISLAKKLCDCVPHFYRKIVDERTCSVKGLHCLAKYKDRLILLQQDCNCTANCEEVNYFVQEIITTPKSADIFPSLSYGIRKFPVMRLKRDVIFGVSDLIVYIGGVMGFFLGFSLLSSIEFIYFFSLRLFWFLIKLKS